MEKHSTSSGAEHLLPPWHSGCPITIYGTSLFSIEIEDWRQVQEKRRFLYAKILLGLKNKEGEQVSQQRR